MSTREERFQQIDAAVARVRPLFWVISPRDFSVSIAWARRTPNAVSGQIRQKILALGLGKSKPDGVGSLTTKSTEERT